MALNKGLTSALGALTGLVGLLAMIRLVAGAGFTSMFAWVFLLAAMLPWIGYCIWRARHGRLRPRAALGVLALAVIGLISVWLFTIGPVIALACSLLAFVIIWVHDWPELRERRESTYVGVEELTGQDQPEDADRPLVGQSLDQMLDQPLEERPDWPGAFDPQRPQELSAETPKTNAA